MGLELLPRERERVKLLLKRMDPLAVRFRFLALGRQLRYAICSLWFSEQLFRHSLVCGLAYCVTPWVGRSKPSPPRDHLANSALLRQVGDYRSLEPRAIAMLRKCHLYFGAGEESSRSRALKDCHINQSLLS